MEKNLDITKPCYTANKFCQSLGPSLHVYQGFYCSIVVRDVTKFPQVYSISMWETEQLQSYMGTHPSQLFYKIL